VPKFSSQRVYSTRVLSCVMQKRFMFYYVGYQAIDFVTNVSKAMIKLVVSLSERVLI